MSSHQQNVPSGTSPAPQRLGKPVLTTLDAVAQSLAIGPVFSAAFVAVLLAGAAGGVAPLATLIGAVGMLALCWVISLYARRYAGAGAVYEYVRYATGPALGMFAAGIYFLGTLFFGGAAIYLVIGLISSATLSSLLGLTIPWWALSLVAALVIFLMNHLGVQITTRMQLTLTVLSILPLLVLALAIIAQGGDSGNTLQTFNPANTTPSSLFHGVFFAITMFIGFETAASLGEETANPRRAIPRALIGTVLLGAAFYVLMTYASAIGFGLGNAATWASDPAPLSTLATRYVGAWLAPIIDIAVIIDMLAVGSAFMATTARGWFALSRDGLLPSVFARTSRFGTPLGGNMLVGLTALVVIGLAAFYNVDPLTATLIATTGGSLLVETIYIVLALVAVRFLRANPWSLWRWLVLVVAAMAPVLAIYGTVVPLPEWPGSLGLYAAVASIGITAIWTTVVLLVYPQRLAVVAPPPLRDASANSAHDGTLADVAGM